MLVTTVREYHSNPHDDRALRIWVAGNQVVVQSGPRGRLEEQQTLSTKSTRESFHLASLLPTYWRDLPPDLEMVYEDRLFLCDPDEVASLDACANFELRWRQQAALAFTPLPDAGPASTTEGSRLVLFSGLGSAPACQTAAGWDEAVASTRHVRAAGVALAVVPRPELLLGRHVPTSRSASSFVLTVSSGQESTDVMEISALLFAEHAGPLPLSTATQRTILEAAQRLASVR